MNIRRFAPALLIAFAACAEEPIALTDTHREAMASDDVRREAMSSGDASPEDASSEDAAPDGASSEDAAPDDAAPEDASPEDAADFVPDVACPTAIITASASEELVVQPGTTILFDGTQSHGDDVSITEYQWEFTSPRGSTAVLTPSSHVATPSLHVEVPGIYTVRLFVVDELGTYSCVPATYRIVVQPTESEFFAVLSWTTPGVADENGADLDLHLMHPLAKGDGRDLDGDGIGDGFCNIPFDAYGLNRTPDWGDADPAILDNPTVKDSARPNEVETAALPILEDDAVYTLAIHAREGQPSLVSKATLKIFRAGDLVFELADIELDSGDLWMAVTFDTSSTELIRTCPDLQTLCTDDDECGGDRCDLRILPEVSCH